MSNSIFVKSIEELNLLKDLRFSAERHESPVSVTGVSGIHKAQLTIGIYDFSPILIITEDEAGARRISDDINEMSGEICSYVYPAKDFTFTDVETVSREYEHTRLGILSRILNNSCRFVCASAEAVLQRTIPPEILAARTVKISKGDSLDTTRLTADLVAAGYTRCDLVEGASQFSVRGSIIDIFPVQESAPIRIELWGDEIDTMSYFDAETQRRTEPLESIKISPAAEVLFDSAEEFSARIAALSKSVRGKHSDAVKTNLARDIDRLNTGLPLGNIDKYLPLAYEIPADIFDYLDPERSIVIFSEYRNCVEKAKPVLLRYAEDIKLLLEEGELCKGLDGYMLEFPELMSRLDGFMQIYMNTFMRSSDDLRFKRLLTVSANQTAPWGGEIRQLIEDLQSYLGSGYSVIVMAGSEKTLPIIANDLREEGIACDILTERSEPIKGRALLMSGCVSSGYDYPEIKSALITQAKAAVSKRKAKKLKKGEEIKSLADIAVGDLVVHALHGIGRFEGIRKLELEGVTKDYITIKYAGTDVLYVPVNQLDMVSRYIGPRDDSGVKLNKLSSNEWQKTRNRVKKAVKDMAEELTKLYAVRSQTKGFAFSEECDWQRDFEERFPYTETDDQLRCIQEIKEDMEKPIPMDRLLCGDVGFGKTEVAFRAAFKCMLDSKQCVLLTPTTVLAWQHYQTAIKRFEHFPMKIQLLSRFRNKKEQTEIINQLRRGEIDMVIGTHRLVQKDVVFKDLGLVIIDEEQRFGVAHKERFKEAFAGVDVLTLSATPIPRTLNMAMSGIRDMSVIEEPPIDRHPVQTYVIEHNMGVIVQAITKELRRGGQVYYIHNRIDSIAMCADSLAKLLPDARIGVAHGQLTEEQLSDIWQQLVEHEIDILVCTTLIETGVDVPNVNTLIIEDADHLGLSQLYQLRGRVGRSSRRAFAYFTFRRGKVLTEIAAKRLDAIREFTQFGSGFRIAMRDLEIRGAGSILGGKQHGHMEAVGYDMYLQLLSEAIAEEKGEMPPHRPEECLIDLQIEAHIPESYVESLSARLDIYRKIAGLQTKEDSMDLIDELIDRYGDPPKAIQGLITVALLRNMAGSMGITEVTQRNGMMLFYVKTAAMEQIQALVKAFKGRVTVNGSEKPYIAVKIAKEDRPAELMESVINIMHENLPAEEKN
ncbi:MAG: transcription-repair coupling factor [Oscillospiraceae bacterium]|nr:transcription-repair coupling factor [Oscillospiraceae bacterium]